MKIIKGLAVDLKEIMANILTAQEWRGVQLLSWTGDITEQ